MSKPPLGLMPKSCWIESRIRDLAKAIARQEEHLDGRCDTQDEVKRCYANIIQWSREIVEISEMK